jgi:hypothetical protein
VTAAHSARTSIDELLRTADLLLSGHLDTTPVARHRGASLVLRTALEIAVNEALESAHPGLSRTNMRAKLLCLRSYATPETARLTTAVWSHVCLGCHYHRYEIGPTHAQVRTWRHEIATLVSRLIPSATAMK